MKEDARLKKLYSKHYSSNQRMYLYPTEFVVRTFLGRYPKLKMSKELYGKANILDLGFGDGRNIGLLSNLGFKVCGVEITRQIVSSAKKTMALQGYTPELKVGRNNNIPYRDGFFNYVLACHSCYYVDQDDSFSTNINEIARVLKPSGVFIGSIPMKTNYITKGATLHKDGSITIKNDPLKIRNGQRIAIAKSKSELKSYLGNRFDSIIIGSCKNDFWGINEEVYIFKCIKF